MLRAPARLPAPDKPPTTAQQPPETPPAMTRILVLLAHPQLESSRVTRALVEATRPTRKAGRADRTSAPGPDTIGPDPIGPNTAGPHTTELRDLYTLYPDYLIDVAAEQAALAGVDLLVWLHPIHWYGMPPLMKLWLDEVFTFGWAYGPGGQALRGTDLWLVTSTGGPESSYRGDGYNRYFFDAFLPPYEQTANLAGLRFLPPLVLHGAHRADAAELARHAAVYAERLDSYPHWPELDEIEAGAACDVPADARPAD